MYGWDLLFLLVCHRHQTTELEEGLKKGHLLYIIMPSPYYYY